MIVEYRVTLVSEGSSDRMLQPALHWLISQYTPGATVTIERADLGELPQPPKRLCDKVSIGYQIYPCDLMLVHRDADNVEPDDRHMEVADALQQARTDDPEIPEAVPVVPVRMSEAWLLIDEPALRSAAGNPRGREAVSLPALQALEAQPNPKKMLHDLLRNASGTRGRKLRNFDVGAAKFRLADLISNYDRLRELRAFQRLEADIKRVLSEWPKPSCRFDGAVCENPRKRGLTRRGKAR